VMNIVKMVVLIVNVIVNVIMVITQAVVMVLSVNTMMLFLIHFIINYSSKSKINLSMSSVLTKTASSISEIFGNNRLSLHTLFFNLKILISLLFI
jgi:hypothetical protein